MKSFKEFLQENTVKLDTKQVKENINKIRKELEKHFKIGSIEKIRIPLVKTYGRFMVHLKNDLGIRILFWHDDSGVLFNYTPEINGEIEMAGTLIIPLNDDGIKYTVDLSKKLVGKNKDDVIDFLQKQRDSNLSVKGLIYN